MAAVVPVLYLALVSAVEELWGTCAIHVDLVMKARLSVKVSVVQKAVVTAIAVLQKNAHVMITGLVPHATLLYVPLNVKKESVQRILAQIIISAFATIILEELTVVHPFARLHAGLLEVDVLWMKTWRLVNVIKHLDGTPPAMAVAINVCLLLILLIFV